MGVFAVVAIVGVILLAGFATIVLSIAAMFPADRLASGVVVGLLPAAAWAAAIYVTRDASFAVVALVAVATPVVFAVATSRWHRF